MTALSAEKSIVETGDNGRLGRGVGASSITIYKGALVCWNASGLITNATDTANFKIAGVAIKTYVLGASNTTEVVFRRYHEEWFVNDGNIDSNDIGLDACVLDNATLTNAATASNDVRAGQVQRLETRDGVSGVVIAVAQHALAAG